MKPFDILIVEDDAADSFLLRRALEPLVGDAIRIEPRAAGVGAALDRRRPGLIVTDLKLPGADGASVIQSVRRKPGCENLPVVVCSTSHLPADIKRSYKAGANGYVCKPSNLEGWSLLAERLVGYWRDLNLVDA